MNKNGLVGAALIAAVVVGLGGSPEAAVIILSVTTVFILIDEFSKNSGDE